MDFTSSSIYELRLSYLFGSHTENSLINEDLLLLDSGRSALYFLLDGIKSVKNGLDVYVNAYTTDVVHTTIRSLGLNLIPYDINPYNFEARTETLDLSERSIFIQTGLFGFKSFNAELQQIVNNSGAFLVEDCCNSFKTGVSGKEAGTIGDAAIYSFRVGKALSSGGGALRVLNPRYREILNIKYEQIKEITAFKSKLKLLRVCLDYLAFNPLVLKNISRPVRKLQKYIPALSGLVKGGVVDTEFKVNSSKIHKMGKYQLKLANIRLANFNKEMTIKKAVSDTLTELLLEYPLHLYASDTLNYNGWNYLFYPILLNEGDPDKFVEHLRSNGFDATRFHHAAVKNSFPNLSREQYPGTFVLIDKLVVIPNTTRMLGKEEALARIIGSFFE